MIEVVVGVEKNLAFRKASQARREYMRYLGQIAVIRGPGKAHFPPRNKVMEPSYRTPEGISLQACLSQRPLAWVSSRTNSRLHFFDFGVCGQPSGGRSRRCRTKYFYYDNELA